jgi:hypothetical protein
MLLSVMVNELYAEWVWVACNPTKEALHGILRVLHSKGLAAPTNFHLVSDPSSHSRSGCLLKFSTASDASGGIENLLRWVSKAAIRKVCRVLMALAESDFSHR